MIPGSSTDNDTKSEFPFDICNLLLGRGGSGQVFLGRFRDRPNEYVAVKRRYTSYESQFTLSSEAHPGARMLVYNDRPTSFSQNACPLPRNHAALLENGECYVTSNGFGSCIPITQQREIDICEESIKEAVVLSRQGTEAEEGVHNGDIHSTLLEDEISVLQYLGPHPQIVKYLGSYLTSRRVSFFTMELMDSDISRELKEGNSSIQTESVCVSVVFSILMALEHLHTRGIVHRDIKPGNILLRRVSKEEIWPCVYPSSAHSAIPMPASEQQQNILQFDADEKETLVDGGALHIKASLGDFSAAHTIGMPAVRRGTLHYSSPEQLMGKREVISENPAAMDMWSLGCTMYEMTTGRRPFSGNSELQVLMNMLDSLGSSFQTYPEMTGNPALFRDLNTSPSFTDLLKHLLDLNPKTRYTAKDALSHPLFANILSACVSKGLGGDTGVLPRSDFVLVFPLRLHYASAATFPRLQFTRVSNTPCRKQRHDHQGEERLIDLLGPTSAMGRSEYTDQSTLERSPSEKRCGSRGITLLGGKHTPREGKGTFLPGSTPRPSTDWRAASFISDGSFLHWSEIRPAQRPPLPMPPSILFSAPQQRSVEGVEKTPSLGSDQQPSVIRSTCHSPSSSSSLCRPTVFRALNISDTGGKVARTEHSGFQLEHDLSPIPMMQQPPCEQLKCRNACESSCSPVRHSATALISPAATFLMPALESSTAAGPGVTANSVDPEATCTPRRRVATARPHRALHFSEEPERCSRRAWRRSSVSQPSTLNSFTPSPALAKRCFTSSPHSSPIQLGAAAAHASLDVAMSERSSGSLEDSVFARIAHGIPSLMGALNFITASTAEPQSVPTDPIQMMLQNASKIPTSTEEETPVVIQKEGAKDANPVESVTANARCSSLPVSSLQRVQKCITSSSAANRRTFPLPITLSQASNSSSVKYLHGGGSVAPTETPRGQRLLCTATQDEECAMFGERNINRIPGLELCSKGPMRCSSGGGGHRTPIPGLPPATTTLHSTSTPPSDSMLPYSTVANPRRTPCQRYHSSWRASAVGEVAASHLQLPYQHCDLLRWQHLSSPHQSLTSTPQHRCPNGRSSLKRRREESSHAL